MEQATIKCALLLLYISFYGIVSRLLHKWNIIWSTYYKVLGQQYGQVFFKQIKWPITSGSECRSVKQENNLPLKSFEYGFVCIQAAYHLCCRFCTHTRKRWLISVPKRLWNHAVLLGLNVVLYRHGRGDIHISHLDLLWPEKQRDTRCNVTLQYSVSVS